MQMADRAIELLALPDDVPSYILDLGYVSFGPTPPDVIMIVCRCGSGLSGQALTEAGHSWVGVDSAGAC